jgi:RNA polymerase sigma-70 factor (ECF subfamily)
MPMERGDGGDVWRERALRDAVLAGDTAAWRSWYDEHFARIAGYIGWRCGGLADLVDDAVQETWLTAIRRLQSFDPSRGSFHSWLCGIGANAVRNALRSRRRQASRRRPLAAAPEPATITDPAAAEKGERVAAALEGLPNHYEAVLRAKYLDRRTVDEIAASRGESPKAVESLLTRARHAFRKAYETSHE